MILSAIKISEISHIWSCTAPTQELKNLADNIFISLTTIDCYSQNTAFNIVNIIQERFTNYSDKKNEIHTCVQEAILNAIIHGNLNVAGKFREVSDFAEYYAKIERRLTLKKYSSKLIHINIIEEYDSLKISVSDEGKGFTIPKNIKDTSIYLKPYGRGLRLINAMADKMWVGADKRTLNMLFVS